MLFLYIFPTHFISAFTLYWYYMTFQLYWIILNSIFILMLDIQAGQVEGLFSLTRMPFFHD